jgi:hypothetical protein
LGVRRESVWFSGSLFLLGELVKVREKIPTQEHSFLWSNKPKRRASLDRTFLCARPCLLLKRPEFREQTCRCVADGCAQIAQPHRGVERDVARGLAFLCWWVGVWRLSGEEGASRPGLYIVAVPGQDCAREASISSSLCIAIASPGWISTK